MRGGEPEEDPPHHQAQPVAVPPAPARTPAPGPGLGVARHAAERAMGDRYDASLLRPRRLVSPDGDHRLLRPDNRRLATLAVRRCERRGGGPRRGAAQPADQPGGPRAGAQIDNGLVFGAQVFVEVARRYGVGQEYSTPYTPQQHG